MPLEGSPRGPPIENMGVSKRDKKQLPRKPCRTGNRGITRLVDLLLFSLTCSSIGFVLPKVLDLHMKILKLQRQTKQCFESMYAKKHVCQKFWHKLHALPLMVPLAPLAPLAPSEWRKWRHWHYWRQWCHLNGANGANGSIGSNGANGTIGAISAIGAPSL